MSLITFGRRAAKYIPIARKKMEELRKLAPPFLGALVGLPAGWAKVVKLGAIDKIAIKVREPYLIVNLRFRDADGALRYREFFGGVTDEPFERDIALRLPPEIPLYYVGITMGWAGHGSVLQVFTTQLVSTSHASVSEVIDGVTYGTFVNNTTDIIFGVYNYPKEKTGFLPVSYSAVCNLRGQPLVQFEPLGDYAADKSSLALKLTTLASAPGYQYDFILRIDDALALDTPVTLWPPSDLNGGHPELALVGILTCCGRGKLAFISSYRNDWRHLVPSAPPDLVIMDNFGATHVKIPILSIDPSLSTYLNSGNDYALGAGSSVTYSGDGWIHLFLIMGSGGSERRMYSTQLSSLIWTQRTLPTFEGSFDFTGFDAHSVISAFKGHIEYYSILSGVPHNRVMSLDHGATWTISTLVADEVIRRGSSNACILEYKEDGTPKKYVKLYNGSSTEEPTNYKAKLRVIKDFDSIGYLYEITASGGVDYVTRTGELGPYYSDMCLFGSKEYPAPLLPGHPNELEFPA